MKAWASWFPDLALHVPGCPNALMEHELRRAAQAYFMATKSWIIDRPALLPVPVNTGELAIDAGSPELELVEVEAVWLDGRQLHPVTPKALDDRWHDDWALHTGTPERYLEPTLGLLRIYPRPLADATTGLKLRMAVRPSEAATGLPDDIALRVRDTIHVGAKARLMLMPKKAWTDMTLGAAYATAFNSQVEAAAVRAAKAHVRARVRSPVNWC